MRAFGLDSCGSGQEQMVRCCKYGSEPSGVTECGELLNRCGLITL